MPGNGHPQQLYQPGPSVKVQEIFLSQALGRGEVINQTVLVGVN